jgi:hypothetical protein
MRQVVLQINQLALAFVPSTTTIDAEADADILILMDS